MSNKQLAGVIATLLALTVALWMLIPDSIGVKQQLASVAAVILNCFGGVVVVIEIIALIVGPFLVRWAMDDGIIPALDEHIGKDNLTDWQVLVIHCAATPIVLVAWMILPIAMTAIWPAQGSIVAMMVDLFKESYIAWVGVYGAICYWAPTLKKIFV